MLLPNAADADEVLAETNLRLWERFDEYDSNKDFGGWARAIAHYEVLTRRKQIMRRQKVISDAAFEALAADAWEVTRPADRRASALRT